MTNIDAGRFKPHHEPLSATVVRNGTISIVVASVLTRIHLRHLPATPTEWYGWLALVLLVAWPSFGGHGVELFYLNRLRPKLTGWSSYSLMSARVAVWLIGGTVLMLCALLTYTLMMTRHLAPTPLVLRTLIYGGPLFVAIELVVHTLLLLSRRPSFWDFRG